MSFSSELFKRAEQVSPPESPPNPSDSHPKAQHRCHILVTKSRTMTATRRSQCSVHSHTTCLSLVPIHHPSSAQFMYSKAVKRNDARPVGSTVNAACPPCTLWHTHHHAMAFSCPCQAQTCSPLASSLLLTQHSAHIELCSQLSAHPDALFASHVDTATTISPLPTSWQATNVALRCHLQNEASRCTSLAPSPSPPLSLPHTRSLLRPRPLEYTPFEYTSSACS